MATIGSLAVSITGNTIGIERAAQRTKATLRGVAAAPGTLLGGVKAGFDGIATGFTRLRSVISPVSSAFAGLGLAVTAAGIAHAVKQQMDMVDASAKFAAALGTSSETMLGLQHAADLSGVSVEELRTGLRGFTAELARSAKDKTGGTFGKWGLDAQAISAMQLEQQLGSVAARMAEIQNPAEQIGMLMDIIPKQGMKFHAMLSGGAEGLRQAVTEAKRLGLTLNNFQTDRIQEANDAITRMGSSFRGMAVQLGAELAPSITLISSEITKLSSNGALQSQISSVAEAASMIASLGMDAVKTFQIITKSLTVVLDTITVATLKADHAQKSVLAGLPGIGKYFQGQADMSKGVLDDNLADLRRHATEGKKLWDSGFMSDDVMKMFEDMRKGIVPAGEAMRNAIRPPTEANKEWQQLVTDTEKLKQSLTDSVAAFGQSSHAVEVTKLRMRGASSESIEELQKLARELETLESITNRNSSALTFVQNYQAAVNRLNDAFRHGLISAVGMQNAIGKLGAEFSKSLDSEAWKVFEETRTPFENLTVKLSNLGTLLQTGRIDLDTYSRSVRKIGEEVSNLSKAKLPEGLLEGTSGTVSFLNKLNFDDSQKRNSTERLEKLMQDQKAIQKRQAESQAAMARILERLLERAGEVLDLN